MTKPITIRLKEELIKELKEYSEETDIPYTRIIVKAVKEYLKKKKENNI